ncbi:MAG: phosphoribosylformylglycinamidine synthase subunit PurS [Actinomycetota bacterium]
MKRRFEVIVKLKEDLLDPQGKALEDALPTMGWNEVSEVRVGKHITLTVDEEDAAKAREVVDDVARRLLSNPVIELYWVREGTSPE